MGVSPMSQCVRIGWWAQCLLVAAVLPLGAADPDRRLPDAARRQDRAAVRALVRDRADVNGRLPDGATALHWATHWDDVETVELLISAGADVNAANDFGVTPLSMACAAANVSIAEALMQAGANPNAPISSQETPLMTAARTGSVPLVRALLARGADVHASESARGQTALMWAASEQHVEVIRLLIAAGASPSARSTAGFTPLMFAARGSNLDVASALVDGGANVNDVAADGTTALVVATVRGHVDVAKFLLGQGADPNASGTGYTALHWAAGSWETELTGPRGIAADRDEEWASLSGLGSRKLELVGALLAHGANPDVRVTKPPPKVGFSVARPMIGATPFFLAAMAGDAAVMRALAKAGADGTMAANDRTTPLMIAAGVSRVLAESRVTAQNTLEAVTAAWELGGDVNAVNAAGDTALHGAAHIRADAVVRFLVEKGAELSVKNKRGETPLMVSERSIAAGSAPVYMRTSTGDLLRELGAR
jgi:ankyrin repeat protein